MTLAEGIMLAFIFVLIIFIGALGYALDNLEDKYRRESYEQIINTGNEIQKSFREGYLKGLEQDRLLRDNDE